jgi:hypothetical protein
MIKVVDWHKHNMLNSLNNKLRNALTAFDLEVFNRIGVDQQHFEFASVATVDKARRIETGNAVLQSKTASRLHESGMALGDRHRKARWH